MKLQSQLTLPSDVGRLVVQLNDLIVKANQQINRMTEGSISAVHNARTAPPTTGVWARGDFVRNLTPTETSGQVIFGWGCTVGGEPGTWRQLNVPTENFVSGAGPAGPTGPTGATGPAVMMVADVPDPEMALPGPRGADGVAGGQGIQGVQGAVGAALYMMLDVPEPEIAWPGPAGVATAGVAPKRVVGVVFDGGGSPPTAGSVGYLVCPFAGTIDQWHVVADQSGSAVVDVWKAAGSIPTNGNTIAGSEKLTLAAQQIASDTALSSWTTSVAAGDVFGFELESVSTCTRLTAEVRILEAA